jgi:hypothetical protein
LPANCQGWQNFDMLQAIGVVIFLVLAYTVLALAAERLGPAYGAGAAFLGATARPGDRGVVLSGAARLMKMARIKGTDPNE